MFNDFVTSVDPVKATPLYSAETHALHLRTLDNIRNHQLTGVLSVFAKLSRKMFLYSSQIGYAAVALSLCCLWKLHEVISVCVFVTNPAGVDMYVKLPNGDLSSKRSSCRNETIHRNNNEEFHGSNVGMTLFHDKVGFDAGMYSSTCTVQAALYPAAPF